MLAKFFENIKISFACIFLQLFYKDCRPFFEDQGVNIDHFVIEKGRRCPPFRFPFIHYNKTKSILEKCRNLKVTACCCPLAFPKEPLKRFIIRSLQDAVWVVEHDGSFFRLLDIVDRDRSKPMDYRTLIRVVDTFQVISYV